MKHHLCIYLHLFVFPCLSVSLLLSVSLYIGVVSFCMCLSVSLPLSWSFSISVSLSSYLFLPNSLRPYPDLFLCLSYCQSLLVSLCLSLPLFLSFSVSLCLTPLCLSVSSCHSLPASGSVTLCASHFLLGSLSLYFYISPCFLDSLFLSFVSLVLSGILRCSA